MMIVINYNDDDQILMRMSLSLMPAARPFQTWRLYNNQILNGAI